MWKISLAALLLLAGACKQTSPGGIEAGDIGPLPPQWHFEPQTHPAADVTLTSVYGRNDEVIFVAGWYGTIMTNKNGAWELMPVPTTEHLTAITGVNNGGLFGLPAPEGEMFAVGWHGTLLHFHPNPDDDPLTDDGAWELVAGPTGASFTSLLAIDPSCPDFDGDGIADDGDADNNNDGPGPGYWGDQICTAGQNTQCDDNCRMSANGPQRPLVDTTLPPDACLDVPDPDPTHRQEDQDGDGIGTACDSDDTIADPPLRFNETLFSIWADDNGTDVRVVAVGENGAIVSYDGPAASEIVAAPRQPISVAAAWVAQTGMPYRYDSDCPAGTPPNSPLCGGRIPPSCPAQCNPLRNPCPCPSGQGQCCDAGASTGVGCTAPLGCAPAANACAGGTCSTLCPGCFRRVDKTLRSVAFDGTNLIAVGEQGTVLVGDPTNPAAEWTFPTCVPTPKPLDENPVLTGICANGGTTHITGAAGAVFRFPDSGSCSIGPRGGSPPGFLSACFATGGNRAMVVGDRGLFLSVDGGADPQVTEINSKTDANLLGITRTINSNNDERFWLVGATGVFIKAGYY